MQGSRVDRGLLDLDPCARLALTRFGRLGRGCAPVRGGNCRCAGNRPGGRSWWGHLRPIGLPGRRCPWPRDPSHAQEDGGPKRNPCGFLSHPKTRHRSGLRRPSACFRGTADAGIFFTVTASHSRLFYHHRWMGQSHIPHRSKVWRLCGAKSHFRFFNRQALGSHQHSD